MDPVIRHAVAANAVQTVLRDLDAHAPDAGPFPAGRWELELPPPYGPARRLVIRLDPVPDHAGACSMRGDVSGAGRLLGVYLGNSDALAALENGEALARLEAFLEWALEDVDQLVEAMQPFDLPLVAIDRDGMPFAVLDHRDVGIEAWGPGDLNCAWWRLLVRRGGAWDDAGVANSQAAGTRSGLHGRIHETLASFDGLAVDEFTFRLWKPTPGEIGAPIRGRHSLQRTLAPPLPRRARESWAGIPVDHPAIARLRAVCGAVINAAPSRGEALLEAIRTAMDRARAEEADRAARAGRRRNGMLETLRSALRRITAPGSR
ncbi:MAG TPA: hypothetical protein VFR81_18700 [Longimicrobium sp.]|nr:hypothetical protein [Longimicrobium sp.]